MWEDEGESTTASRIRGGGGRGINHILIVEEEGGWGGGGRAGLGWGVDIYHLLNSLYE